MNMDSIVFGVIITIICLAYVVYMAWEDEFVKDDSDDKEDDDTDLPKL